jgi:hypothetical protein
MSEAAVPMPVGNTKPCKVCGEAIKKVAPVCIHCNNYQYWRAHLNVSGKVLALLIALFAVFGVVVPIFTTAITPENSKLFFFYLGADAHSISLLATNSGIRASPWGQVRQIKISWRSAFACAGPHR